MRVSQRFFKTERNRKTNFNQLSPKYEIASVGQIFEHPLQNSTQASGLETFGALSPFVYTPCVQKSAHALQFTHFDSSTIGYHVAAIEFPPLDFSIDMFHNIATLIDCQQ